MSTQEVALEELIEKPGLFSQELQDYWRGYARRDFGRCQQTLEMLDRIGEGKRVLEVGSFPGLMSVLLQSRGWDLDCVDLNPERMQGLVDEYGIRVQRVDVESEPLPFEDDSFDQVLFTEVLEHLRINPIGALREAQRVLRPGGALILSVPNIKPMQRLRFLFGVDYQGDVVAEFAKLERVGHMGHLRLYSRADVEGILRYLEFSRIESQLAGRLDLPSPTQRLVLGAIGLVAKLVPNATFEASREAHSSHLYVVAHK